MLVSQPLSPTLHGQCGEVYSDDDDSPMDSPPASYRRRRFFKSGLSTYEEMYSRNATGRRLGRYSLHVKLKTERPTITLLLSNFGGPEDDPVDIPMLLSPASKVQRHRSASESEMNDPSSDEFKQRSSSFDDMMQRASSLPEVMRPKAIATDKFSFFRHRSCNPRRGGSSITSSCSHVSNDGAVSLSNTAINTEHDMAVRPSFPLVPVDDGVPSETPVPPTDATVPRDSSPTSDRPESQFNPRDSSFSVMNDGSTSFKPVAIRNSVSNNVNVVRFVSGYKNTKAANAFHPRGHGSASSRSSLDGRPSLDSVRKSARHKKNAYMTPEAGLNKKLREARNRIPLEFRDELSHLLEKPYVAKPKLTQKSVHFNADANHTLIFEWESDTSTDTNDDADNGIEPASSGVHM